VSRLGEKRAILTYRGEDRGVVGLPADEFARREWLFRVSGEKAYADWNVRRGDGFSALPWGRRLL
jgi:hypothetical protein